MNINLITFYLVISDILILFAIIYASIKNIQNFGIGLKEALLSQRELDDPNKLNSNVDKDMSLHNVL